jgi:hypothetical protein
MPRRLRDASGGLVYHVLNRATGRRTLFAKDEDYLAFEVVLEQLVERTKLRILSYTVMPNHWGHIRGRESLLRTVLRESGPLGPCRRITFLIFALFRPRRSHAPGQISPAADFLTSFCATACVTQTHIRE